MTKVELVEAHFGGTPSKTSFSTATVINLGKGGFKTRLYTSQNAALTGVSLYNDTYSFSYEPTTKNANFRYKTNGPLKTKLTINQFIPASKWFLIPTPAITITRKGLPLLGDKARISATKDMLLRTNNVFAAVYGGEDKEYKATIGHGTVKGLSIGARAKLRKGLAHSIAGEYSEAFGPVLTAKSRTSEDMKMKLALNGRFKTADLECKFRVDSEETDTSAKVTLNLHVPTKKGSQPRVLVGVKYNFH